MTRRTSRAMMRAVAERLPSGVVTFVLSDIVGSTRLWESVPAAMETALAVHEEIVGGAIAAHGGVLLKARGEGDSTFSVFGLATEALAAAHAAQVALRAARWPPDARLTVRFAVHTGEAVERGGDFLGPAVNRAARLRAVADGGQVLVSESTARLVADRLPAGVRLAELGAVRLRDLDRPEPTYVLAGPGLPEPRARPDPQAAPARPDLSERNVTRKEAEVLDALGEHLTNAEIASRLYISERTVESHVSSLLRKFQVANRHELVRAAGARTDPARSDPAVSGALERDSFPTVVTPLIDRQVESSKISSLLTSHRLVTVVGAGGTGKTRLATHLATAARERAPAETWYAELAGVRANGEIAEVLLAALGVRVSGETDAAERAVRHLSTRRGLLVLDNCEHVRAPAAVLCERIIQLAPEVRVLATSREPLGLPDEVLFPLAPLGTPSDNSLDAIAGADAVRLFVERAMSYVPDFCLDPDNSVAVADLCRSLDGLPLAIELAAARVPTMTPGEIVSRLDQLFRILGHRTDHIDHHRTLHATLDWSYDLLEPDEQVLLSRLAIFAPGFSLSAVEALGQATAGDRHVLDVLSALVAKSMVIAEADHATTRFRLLETIRAYGLEKAADEPGQDLARRRHLEFYTRLAERLAGPAVVADVHARSQQLAADSANIRLALDYAAATNDASSVFQMTAALVDVWCLWGWGGAILSALEAVLPRQDADGPGRADALADAAWSAWSQGQHPQARSWCDESERCSRSDGLAPVARVDLIRGLSRLVDEGDIPAGTALCEQGLDQLRDAGHLRRYAHDLAAYGAYLAVVGGTDRAADVAHQAVALARQLDDQHTLSVALIALGYSSMRSDPDGARTSFGEAVGVGDPWTAASALWGLGWMDDLAGRDGSALRRYREALELWSETGDGRGVFYAVQGIAVVLARSQRLTAAVRLLAGADRLARDVGSHSIPSWNDWRDQHLLLLRHGLDPVEFTISWAAGQQLEPDVLVKEALMAARRADTDGEP